MYGTREATSKIWRKQAHRKEQKRSQILLVRFITGEENWANLFLPISSRLHYILSFKLQRPSVPLPPLTSTGDAWEAGLVSGTTRQSEALVMGHRGFSN
ncbi:hypothetical protein AVEN_152400-1 [Araneus ventricosus]|uniref:Uncharacterized protein n=1 Tax=Araneus ventricosus TaxID=182803 RepID=A0A4Y2DB23_ARAVE|nr:hypothetical protein AVEN_152400-1 [Araneus ventricosus]